ncbi:MAG: hypothetical protein M0R73_08300 [Dehalococcoidia bacterium]|nr:hypothetical protein [Dehalococcoidia bacterium]
MPRVRFFPRSARTAPEWIPPDAKDDAPVLDGHAPDRPEDTGHPGRRRRWAQAGGAALTVAATAGALAWGRKRRDRGR